MILLHAPIAPWLVRHRDGCELVLWCRDIEPDGLWVRSLADNEEQLIALRADGHDGRLSRWRARLPWDHGNALTRYAFKVVAGAHQHWLAADGLHGHVPPESRHFRVHPHEAPPSWVRDQVFYQIFPDRFARGQAPVDRRGEMLWSLPPRPVVQPVWGTPVDPGHAANAFYGGDLEGIRQRLDYLQHELGVSALLLNPVFSASSNHRYDTENYTTVCPHLGGNAALQALSADLHARGMRLVLDAVVNHTGVNHPWFNRWGRHPGVGAAQSPASPWRGFYAFDAEGQAVGWKGHASLPVLDYRSPALCEAVYAGTDAILRRWLRPPVAADGWRLDVIHMLGEGPGAWRNEDHVRAIRQAVREENPQAYVLGEHFAEATRWLQGDQEDGAMNHHGFTQPVRAWLAGSDAAGHPAALSTKAFERWLHDARSTIPFENQLAQFNLLDSHDTPRFLTVLGGRLARFKLAVLLLFASPGVPSVYCGDEIGLEGGADPDCRRCFDWDRNRWNTRLLEHYRRLATLRSSRDEWRHGAITTLCVDGDIWAFARFIAGAASVIVVNRGDARSVEVPLHGLPAASMRWRDLEGGAVAPVGEVLRLALPREGWRLILGD